MGEGDYFDINALFIIELDRSACGRGYRPRARLGGRSDWPGRVLQGGALPKSWSGCRLEGKPHGAKRRVGEPGAGQTDMRQRRQAGLMQMRRFRFDMQDGQMAGISFGDAARQVEVLFLHATGFNAITYQSLLQPLGSLAHCAALDLRGHGRSTLYAKPALMKSWNRFRDDVIQFLEKEAPRGAVLGGHSMGATVALLVAGRRPDLVKGLVLTDPVLLKPEFYRWFNLPLLGELTPKTPLARQAIRRRRDFESPGEAAEFLRGRGAFKTWRNPFLDDYVIDGVLRQDNGAFALACTPEWEAAVFTAHRYLPWSALAKLRRRRMPIVVLQAEKGSTSRPDTDARFHAVRPDSAVTHVPGTTHFIPMERPYVVRDALRLLYEATIDGAESLDYVGAVRRTINDSIGVMD